MRWEAGTECLVAQEIVQRFHVMNILCFQSTSCDLQYNGYKTRDCLYIVNPYIGLWSKVLDVLFQGSLPETMDTSSTLNSVDLTLMSSTNQRSTQLGSYHMGSQGVGFKKLQKLDSCVKCQVLE